MQQERFRSAIFKKRIQSSMTHLAIGAGDLGEDAHHRADEMKESHGCFLLC